MLYLVTGMPGNGKTLYSVDWLIRQIETDAQRVKKDGGVPRDFYTDIEGFDAEAVEKLTGYRVLPCPDDWRNAPEGSVLVYDEAHRRFPATGKPGRAEDERIREMDTHRHGGYDMLFITQWPSKVHHEIRQLVGEHVHLNRAMGLESAGLCRWPRVQADPYDERQREKSEEEIWRFPKDRYALYKSSTMHTVSHKFKMPKKIVTGMLSLVGVIVAAWFGFVTFMGNDAKADTTQEPQATAGASALALRAGPAVEESTLTPGVGAYRVVDTQPAPTLAGCVAADTRCRCFNSEGFQIDMTPHECKRLLSEPLPFNIYHEFRVGTSPFAQAQGEKGTGGGSVVTGNVTEVTGSGVKL